YKVDILAYFLDLLSLPNTEFNDSESPKPEIWVSYDFIQGEKGILHIKSKSVFNSKIDWHFDHGKEISKFKTSKFYKLGTVIFMANDRSSLESMLAMLINDEKNIYQIETEKSIPESENQRKNNFFDFLKLRQETNRIFSIISVILTLVVSGSLGSYLCQNHINQAKFLGSILSKTISYNIANGEVYLVANIVNNFEAQKWFSKIVVTDKKYRVIYSKKSEGVPSNFYQESVNPSDFQSSLDITLNGIKVGHLLFDIKYENILLMYFFTFAAAALLIFMLHNVLMKYVFKRYVNKANDDISALVEILGKIKNDLQKLKDQSENLSLESYQQFFEENHSEVEAIKDMESSIYNMILLIRDVRNQIDEKKRLSDLLLESTQNLQESKVNMKVMEALAQLTKILAHDVRKPFSMVKMTLDLMDSNVFKEEPEQLEAAKVSIRKALENVNAMINDIMDYSRVIDLETKPGSLLSVIDFSIRQTGSKYSDYDIHFRYDFNHKNKALIDEQRLVRVFDNIIGNGLEAIIDIGKSRTGTIEISTHESTEKDKIIIIIGNDGPPFKESDIPHLFDSFFTKGKSKGTGLGLASANKIINLHKGDIFARNRNGDKGVEFVITILSSDEIEVFNANSLPKNTKQLNTIKKIGPEQNALEEVASNHLSIESYERKLIEYCRKGNCFLNIAILDDETLYRNALKGLLEKTKELNSYLNIDFFESSLSFISCYPKKLYDFLICDVDLGKDSMNGYETVRWLRENGYQGDICIHSNRSLPEDYSRSVEVGAQAFISKPMSRLHLLKFLVTSIDSKKESISIDRNNYKEEEVTITEKPTIAYIEDDDIFRTHFKRTMKDADVITFETPEIFLGKIGNDKNLFDTLDAVFIDQNYDSYSDIKGIHLGEKLKRLCFKGKVILFSNEEFLASELKGKVDLAIQKEFLSWKEIKRRFPELVISVADNGDNSDKHNDGLFDDRPGDVRKKHHDIKSCLNIIEISASALRKAKAHEIDGYLEYLDDAAKKLKIYFPENLLNPIAANILKLKNVKYSNRLDNSNGIEELVFKLISSAEDLKDFHNQEIWMRN
ncbi:MAG: hybrid sensor histidine kinase/response regulator, partial [Oligoflexales bacterium]|nr:hybrid sensor histidine kinase/response regulator [Oligoflexales bacterium]